jgi:hypothetical protein
MNLKYSLGYWLIFCMMLIILISTIITTVSFIAVLVNLYNNRLLTLIRQFILIPSRINAFIYLRPYYFTSVWTSAAGI